MKTAEAVGIEMTIGERGQVVIPKSIRTQLGIKPKMKVRMTVRNGLVELKPQRDLSSFDAAFQKWRGTGLKRIQALGFKDGDEYLEAIRGR
jgi:AbrB family looped-hinge helix DNA binding protein